MNLNSHVYMPWIVYVLITCTSSLLVLKDDWMPSHQPFCPLPQLFGMPLLHLTVPHPFDLSKLVCTQLHTFIKLFICTITNCHGQRGQDVKLTTHIHLVSRLIVTEAVPPTHKSFQRVHRTESQFPPLVHYFLFEIVYYRLKSERGLLINLTLQPDHCVRVS
jgi:hypothetical protein